MRLSTRIYLYRDANRKLTHHRPRGSGGEAGEVAAYIQCGTFVDDVGFWATTQEAIDYFNDRFTKRFGEDGVTGGGLAETMLGLKIHYNDDELSSEMTDSSTLYQKGLRITLTRRSRARRCRLVT